MKVQVFTNSLTLYEMKHNANIEIFIQSMADMICDSYYWDELIEKSNNLLASEGLTSRVKAIGVEHTTDVVFTDISDELFPIVVFTDISGELFPVDKNSPKV